MSRFLREPDSGELPQHLVDYIEGVRKDGRPYLFDQLIARIRAQVG